MKKKSGIVRNWPKYLLQWGLLLLLIAFFTGLIPTKEPADPETYCPLGGLQALSTYLANHSLPCSMSSMQIVMGLLLAVAVILFSKLFCGYLCPIGTVEDLFIRLRKGLKIKALPLKNGSVADAALRIVKYFLLFWIFYMTISSSELFCKQLDPYYAAATGFKGEITLWMSLLALAFVVLGGFFVDRFWCRYLCPLGAISNSLKFWLWIGVLFGLYFLLHAVGVAVPWWALLAAFCLLGYLLEILVRRPKLQLLNVVKAEDRCTHCGLCRKACPYNIDLDAAGDGRLCQADCVLCGDCVPACPTGALSIGVNRKAKGGFWNFLPAILTVALLAAGMAAGRRFELPTIDVTWGTEEGGAEQLQTLRIDNLRSVKCYGSSMALKAKLERISGVHGVKTFVKHHYVQIAYDPAVIDDTTLLRKVYVPSAFKVQTPDPAECDSLKVLTLRIENMRDKLDLNYLGLQFRYSDKRIYGLQSEFACPVIVRVYLHPEEQADEKWFKEIVNRKALVIPLPKGGVKELEMNLRFERLEKGEGRVGTEDFIKRMFSGAKAESKKKAEEYAGKPQFQYDFTDPNYDKPVYKANFNYLGNYLLRKEGVIGVYLLLNRQLLPTIRIRFAAPMTEERLTALLRAEKWDIKFSDGEIRQLSAPMAFRKDGVCAPAEQRQTE